MKRYRLAELGDVGDGHFLKNVVSGDFLCKGGMGFKKPGARTHTDDGPGGRDYHVHEDDCEVFVILQGKARMEIDGLFHDLHVGDVMVIDPGEDHHLIADEEDPCINLWLHAGASRHPDHGM